MALTNHNPDWLLTLLEQNNSIYMDVVGSLRARVFDNLSEALTAAKALSPKQLQNVACVQHKYGWCACAGTTIRYRDGVRTKCKHIVTLPFGLEFRQPTCEECINALRR